MKHFDDLVSMAKITDLVGKKEEEKSGKKIVWVLAIIGAIAAIAAIAYAVYAYMTPDYYDDFEDDFDDDFDDDFYDDDEDLNPTK